MARLLFQVTFIRNTGEPYTGNFDVEANNESAGRGKLTAFFTDTRIQEKYAGSVANFARADIVYLGISDDFIRID